MKKIGAQVAMIVAVFVLCYVFAQDTLLWEEDITSRMSSMSEEDIVLTILDEDTIQLENLIKGSDVSYSWIIKNYIDGNVINSGELLDLESNDIIQLTIEELGMVEFQAVVVYDGYKYTSNTFSVSENGDISLMSDEDNASIESDDVITRDISDIVSIAFLCFLLVTVFFYYILPKKCQWIVLLAASVCFYTLSGVQYILFILGSAAITYVVARKMSVKRQAVTALMKEADAKTKKGLKAALQRENKQWLSLALIGSLGVMVVIKYSDFVVSNMNAILHTEWEFVSFVMPIGLSFYTFMLIAYLMDVYRGKYEAEEKFGKFFLFISFFPHVSQGPIARYNDVAPQLSAGHRFDYDNFCFGAQRILWGFFVKLVLADRIASVVNGVYGDYANQSWFMLLLASIAYSIQIYADFYSSMEIAIGSAQLFDIQLGENFMRPYFSTTMPEFWRRWHISLGTWFKDYVFYPISISKKSMKFSVWTRKKYGANASRILSAVPPIMGVWILTGLWHGASWSFIAWGLFHGVLILLSTAFSQNIQNILPKIGIKTDRWDYKLLQMCKVFMLCTIGRVFFRTGSVSISIQIFKNIITLSHTDSIINFSQIGLDMVDYIVLAVALMLLLGVSIVQERVGSVREQIYRANIWMRWSIWIFLILAVVIFGVYGVGTAPVFLYEAF